MITLRTAQLSDLGLLKYWDQQPHVVASNPNDEWDWEAELRNPPPGFEQWIAEQDGKPVGFLQIIDPAIEPTRYWGETGDGYRAIDIWIGDVKDLGKGIGTEMMKLAIERCFSDPEVQTILVDPLATNTKSHAFYKKLGFQFAERRQFGDDVCCVYKLEKKFYSREKK